MEHSPSQLLSNLGYRSYRDYLKSEHWANVRYRYYKSHARVCYCCGSQSNLELHHLTYERLGREKLRDLIALCKACHQTVHALVASNASTLSTSVRALRIVNGRSGNISGELRMKSRRSSDVKITFSVDN